MLFLSGVAELDPEERWPGFHWAYQRGKVKSQVCSRNTITSSQITVAYVTWNWWSGAGLFGWRVTMASLRTRNGTRLTPKPIVPVVWPQFVWEWVVV